MRANRLFLLLSALAAPLATPTAAADVELSFYGGVQGARPSRVTGEDPGLGRFSFIADWKGKSFGAPPYYAVRATWWRADGWGFGVEVNHAKVYSTRSDRTAQGFDRLEMTDGLNLLTVNAMRRFDIGRLVVPYVGVGVGAAVPHVEVTTAAGRTFGYQMTGPAVVWMAGASLPLDDRWSAFGEYKGSRSWNDADLTGGGRLETDITTHAVNIGLSYRF